MMSPPSFKIDRGSVRLGLTVLHMTDLDSPIASWNLSAATGITFVSGGVEGVVRVWDTTTEFARPSSCTEQ